MQAVRGIIDSGGGCIVNIGGGDGGCIVDTDSGHLRQHFSEAIE